MVLSESCRTGYHNDNNIWFHPGVYPGNGPPNINSDTPLKLLDGSDWYYYEILSILSGFNRIGYAVFTLKYKKTTYLLYCHHHHYHYNSYYYLLFLSSPSLLRSRMVTCLVDRRTPWYDIQAVSVYVYICLQSSPKLFDGFDRSLLESGCREKYRLFMYHISATRTQRVEYSTLFWFWECLPLSVSLPQNLRGHPF